MLICPLPSVVLGASGIIGAGATTTAMGMSDVAEGEQEVWYGATGSTRESVNPVLKHVFKGNRGAYNFAEIIATLVASCGLIAIQPYAKSLGMKKAAQGATSAKSKPVNTSALRLQGEKVNAVEETKLAGNAKAKPKSSGDALYARGKFRKSARINAENAAPKNKNGEMLCPTCGKVIPKKITQETVNGPRQRVGYDLDHYPDTWSERVDKFKQREMPPTRAEVLNEYNRELRVQCPKCNEGHQFEGIEGTFKGDN
jgi:hypothetical protein